MNIPHIPNDYLTQSFKRHLEIEDNNRIIFSGPFGIGKSHFLRDFFETNKKKYNVVHLYPVNYSISSNEDILSLLQYDIIYELISNTEISLEEFDFSKIEMLQWFGITKFDELFYPLLEYIPKMGKHISHLIEALKKLEKFEVKIKKGDADKLNKLRKKVEGKEGSIYRYDAYIDFINKCLDFLKVDNNGISGKKNVLIIDDLDRIDPEHIFRLFNVFAAHFDLSNSHNQNKFGFDKVIFVCDIKNIREIFHYKYGTNVNFNGYIDKFYSVNIFKVDNRSALQHFVELNFHTSNDYVRYLIVDILQKLIKTGVINFRAIQNIRYVVNVPPHTSEYDKELYFTQMARFLAMICGDSKALINNLEECKNKLELNNDLELNTDDKLKLEYLKTIIFPAYEFEKIRGKMGGAYSFYTTSLNKTPIGEELQYNITSGNDHKKVVNFVIAATDRQKLLNSFSRHMFSMIITATKMLDNHGIIN